MIANYNEYIDNLKDLRKKYLKDKNILTKDEFNREKNKLTSLLRNDIIKELSKYFKKSDLKLYKYNKGYRKETGYFQQGWHFIDESEYDIFLLNDDYGIKVKFDKNGLGSPLAKFNTIIKSNNLFVNGTLKDSYNINKGSLEDFIKSFINKVEKQNDIRIKAKKTIELKNQMKKYNL